MSRRAHRHHIQLSKSYKQPTRLQQIAAVANLPGKPCELEVRASGNQGSFLIDAGLRSDMLNAPPPVRPKVVEPQAVLSRIDFIDQALLQDRPLCRVHDTFKDRILHPLAIVLAGLGHTVKATGPAGVFRCNVVTHQYKHPDTLPTSR